MDWQAASGVAVLPPVQAGGIQWRRMVSGVKGLGWGCPAGADWSGRALALWAQDEGFRQVEDGIGDVSNEEGADHAGPEKRLT